MDEMKVSDAKYAYDREYQKTQMKQVKFAINKNTDADIIAHLETVGNVAAYLKQLIRADMAKKQEEK